MKAPLEADLKHAISYVVSRIAGPSGLFLPNLNDDESSISSLDIRLEALNLARESLEKQLNQEIAVIAHRRNTFLPISQLPVELLAEAFHHLSRFDQGTSSSTLALQQILRLRLVSTQWKDVVDGTAHLWRAMTSSAPPHIIEMALRKSKDITLDVIHCPKLEVRFRQMGGLKSLASHIDRWRSAEVDVLMRSELEILAGRSASSLESCDLRFTGQQVEREPINLFLGEAPRLQSVRLRDIDVVWDSDVSSQLRTLDLTYRVSWQWMPRLYTILKACKSLVELYLNLQIQPAITQDHIPSHQEHIPLDKLTTLHLKLQAVPTIALLSAIKAPNCKIFTMSVDEVVPEAILFRLLDLSAPFFPPPHPRKNSPPILHVFISGRKFKTSLRDATFKKPLFTIDVATSRGLAAFTRLFDQLGPVHRRPINSYVTLVTERDSATLFPALQRLPSVVRLHVGSMAMIRYLSTPQNNDDGTAYWPFKDLPRLEVFSGPYDEEQLMAMFRNRYGVTAMAQEGGLPLPVPFRSVTFRHAGAVSGTVRDVINDIVKRRHDDASVLWESGD